VTASAPPAPPFPATIEGDTPDAQMAFLAQVYATVRERILQRTPDPARQEALLALAERLNPAAWTDADQITTGLQQAAEALERLSHVFAKRRRRAKKKPRPAGEPPAAPVPAADSATDLSGAPRDDAPRMPDEGSDD
jgi:hypothetical protein